MAKWMLGGLVGVLAGYAIATQIVLLTADRSSPPFSIPIPHWSSHSSPRPTPHSAPSPLIGTWKLNTIQTADSPTGHLAGVDTYGGSLTLGEDGTYSETHWYKFRWHMIKPRTEIDHGTYLVGDNSISFSNSKDPYHIPMVSFELRGDTLRIRWDGATSVYSRAGKH